MPSYEGIPIGTLVQCEVQPVLLNWRQTMGFFNQRDVLQCIENLEAADQTLVEANPEEALMHLV